MTKVLGVIVFLAGCVLGVSATSSKGILPDISFWLSLLLLFVSLMICSVGVLLWKWNSSDEKDEDAESSEPTNVEDAESSEPTNDELRLSLWVMAIILIALLIGTWVVVHET